jgi:hypothetical protein
MHYVGFSIMLMIGKMLKGALYIMKCILFYNNLMNAFNSSTKTKKCFSNIIIEPME